MNASKEEAKGPEDVPEDIQEIIDKLRGIENIMTAENKRRVESNENMKIFIDEHLLKLKEGITGHVDENF